MRSFCMAARACGRRDRLSEGVHVEGDGDQMRQPKLDYLHLNQGNDNDNKFNVCNADAVHM